MSNRNYNYIFKDNLIDYIIIFFYSMGEKTKFKKTKLEYQNLENAIISREASNWLTQKVSNFYQNNAVSKTYYFLVISLASIINMEIELNVYRLQKEKLPLTKAQKECLDSIISFHQASLNVWVRTITNQPYQWEIDPNYCNEDFQERLEYNVNFLQKLLKLILNLEPKFNEHIAMLQNKFRINYNNIIDLFTIIFINKIDREFKECLVKYQEYSIPKSIRYTEAAILFQDKTEFNKLPLKKQESIICMMERHQKTQRPEINLIEYVAFLAIKQGDENCKQIADEMMKANQEYLKIDLKFRKRKKYSKNSFYYRSYCWVNGEKIYIKNGAYKNLS